jgi:hypothetical protein
MSKRKSKLKAMAEAGNPWAVRTLREAQELGRAAAIRGNAMKRARRAGIAIGNVVEEPVRILLARSITSLTFPNQNEAELALRVLEVAGVGVIGAELAPYADHIPGQALVKRAGAAT